MRAALAFLAGWLRAACAPALALSISWALALHAEPASAQTRTWTPVGPSGGTVLALKRDPYADHILLAGTYFGGLYQSSDWGFNWRPLSTPFSTRSVFAVAYAPSAQNLVYVGTFQAGVYRSTDGGQTWQGASTGLPSQDILALAVDPFNSQHLLVALSAGGVWRSTNGGASWQAVTALASVRGRSLAFDPKKQGAVYLGALGTGVYRSLDGAASWAAFNTGLRVGSINALDFDAAGQLYAAAERGAFQLKVGAASWTDITHNLPDLPLSQLLPHPTNSNFVFAVTHYGVYVNQNVGTQTTWFPWTNQSARLMTTDRSGWVVHVALSQGELRMTRDYINWLPADTGLQNAFVGALATQAGTGGGTKLIAGTQQGVHIQDGTQPWAHPLVLNEAIFDVLPLSASTLLAGAERSGVWKSADGGKTWARSSSGMVPGRIATFSRAAESTTELYAASVAGLYRSTDGGRNWAPTPLPDLPIIRSLAADPVRSPIVYVGSVGGRVYRSGDSGATFSFAGNGLPAEDIVALAHAPWSRVFAITASGKLYATTDNGLNWYASQTGCSHPATAFVSEPTRNWVHYLATAGGGICKSESAGLQWAPANTGLTLPYVTALWMDPGNASVLYAGSQDRIYRSRDGAQSWTELKQGLPAGLVIALQGTKADPNRLYAVVEGQGLYRSTDAGQTWAAVSTGLAASELLGLSVDPASAAKLLLGTVTKGVRATADSGGTWSASSEGMGLFVRSLAGAFGAANTVYAGSLGSGVFRSTDAGASWAPIGLADRNVFRVLSPAANTVLVAASNGVAKSVDGGTTWRELGQRSAYVMSQWVDGSNTQRMLVGGLAGFAWLTEDGGTRWRDASAGLPRADLLALAGCPDGTLYAAADRTGVWSTAASSLTTWRRTAGTELDGVQVLSLACDPRSGFLYAGTNTKGVYLSMNKGVNWAPVSTGLSGTIVATVLPSPGQAWRIWAGTRNGVVSRSNDAGLNWTALPTGLPTTGVNALAESSDGTLYAATGSGVFKLAAGGSTWAGVNSGLPGGSVWALWADPANAQRLLAAPAAGKVYVSTNGGTSWSALTSDATAPVANLGGDAQRLYAGTLGNGLIWLAGGSSFSAAQPADAIPAVSTALAVDATSASTIYVGTGGQGVLVSRDGGAHWKKANTGLGDLFLLSLVADPVTSGVLYAGTGAGVFVSRDGAQTWSAINTGLLNLNVTALTLDRQAPAVVFVGTEGGGAFRYDGR